MNNFQIEILFCFLNLRFDSPIFKIYTIENFENEIKETTKKYIEQHVVLNENTKKIILPSIFSEFKNDFKYKIFTIEESIKNFLQDYFQIVNLKDFKIEIKKSNYNLNYSCFNHLLCVTDNFKEEKIKVKRSQTILERIEKKHKKSIIELKTVKDFEDFTINDIQSKNQSK